MLTTKITDIANAIRNKTGESGSMKLADMPDKITNIQTGEDVEDEVNVQTPLITEITESLVGKATGANATADKILQGYSAYVGQKLVDGNYLPHGLYVWKKYNITKETEFVENPSFDFNSSSSSISFNLTNPNFDFTKIKNFKQFFDYGFSSGDVTLNGSVYNTGYKEVPIGSMSVLTSTKFQIALVATPGRNTSGTFKHEGIIYFEKPSIEFVEYVLSDNSSEYPDEGKQDGYWYEKVTDGFNVTNGTVTGRNSTVTIPHGLGKVPTYFGINSNSGFESYYNKCTIVADVTNITINNIYSSTSPSFNWVAVG